MNKSKKAIKGPQGAPKQQKQTNPKLWIAIAATLSVILLGTILFDQFYKRTIMTIDGDKYYMEDLNYYFYSVESQYDYYNQIFGGTYWDMSYDQTSGLTVRDLAKQEAVDTAVFNEIMYRDAVANGYNLTEEEKSSVATDVESLMNEVLTPDQLKKNEFTNESLTDILNRTKLANRYRTDIIDSLDIDDEGIKAGINKDEYRQYDIEYLFIPTQTTDADGNNVALGEAEKTAAYDKIKAAAEKAAQTEDWSTLVPEGEEDLVYRESSFLAKDTMFSEEFKAVMMAMENDAVSDIYEEENGYYVVRMQNNNSTKSYDNAVEQAITEAENKAFETYYKDEIQPKYEVDFNENYIKSIRLGSLTI